MTVAAYILAVFRCRDITRAAVGMVGIPVGIPIGIPMSMGMRWVWGL